jgi:cell wall-associated NlpC family hydrolase
MAVTPRRSASRAAPLIVLGGAVAVVTAGLGLVLAALLVAPPPSPGSGCGAAAGSPDGIILAAGAGGQRVGATEYGGPGDPSSGTVGASGVSLLAHPDSYAELGGVTFQTAAAMGGLPYMTPLRISWDGRSAVAYKRDFGLGGGPVSGLSRVIDLWWQFAGALRIPYEDGRWSGAVRVARPPASGAANLLDQSPAPAASSVSATPAAGCGAPGIGGVPVTEGARAQLLPGGRAAAPSDAPAAVRGIIAAGNQLVGKPYLVGGGHGLPLDQIAAAYDCSSSVEHLLYGGGLLPAGYDAASGALESFGEPGPGRWVTIYASADHVFVYVAGLRWDTHNAAGPGDGSSGIGWHPLVRESAGFVVRHPVGL